VVYAVRPVLPHAVVHVALAERELTSQVGRGENAGRTLLHDNVVRAFVTADLPASGEGSLTIAAPTNLRSDRAGFIVYVQDARDHRILGATGLALPVPTDAHAERR